MLIHFVEEEEEEEESEEEEEEKETVNQPKTVEKTEPVRESISEPVKEDRLATELVTSQNTESMDTSGNKVIEPVSEVEVNETISESAINLESDKTDEVSEEKDSDIKSETVIANGQIEQSREEDSGGEESDLEGKI